MAERPYDLVIVGAGTTGCILAARIAEKGVHPTTGEPLRIGLFDRGPYFKGEPRPGYGSPQRRHMFTNIAQDFAGKYVTRPGLPPGGQRKVPLQTGEEVHTHPTAALVGGGSLLYTAITQVPHEVDYEVWERETGADWTYQNLKAASEEVKRTFNIHQKPDALLGRLDHMFRDTAQAMGYRPYDATIAKKNCLGSSFCDGTNMCKYDAKMGSFVAYLPIAEQHGVEVIPEAMVERILFEKGASGVKVKGIAFRQHGKEQLLEVPRVIVTCGNFGTPTLLYRSGYGPRELVEGDVVIENRNVGQHTDNRPTLVAPMALFDEPLSNGDYHNGTVQGAFFVYHDRDPKGHYERIEISIRAYEITERPDRLALNSAAPQFGRTHKEFMRGIGNPAQRTAGQRKVLTQSLAGITLVRPRSVRGYVNEWAEQIYRSQDPTILKPLAEGRELAYEFFKKMGAREVLGMERPLRIGRLNTWVGSCRVGTDRKVSVVNPHFESHDIEGLFLCDASVVPRSGTQGYAGTVATVAVFAASRIAENHFKRG